MSEPRTDIILDAVGMILIRSNEVIAVAAVSDSQTKNAIAVESSSNAIDDNNDLQGINKFVAHVLVLPNPDKEDRYIPQNSSTHCTLVDDSARASHLSRISSWPYILDLWYVSIVIFKLKLIHVVCYN
jgi:hypothetical protein